MVTYGYHSRMLLNSVIGESQYVTFTTYDAAGRIVLRTLGNGLTQSYGYYTWDEEATVDRQQVGQGGRLKNITVGSLQNMSYLYDAAGNIHTLTNSITTPAEVQSYGYDALHRLISATAANGPAPYSEAYSYDPASGNLASKVGTTLTYNEQVTCMAGTRTIPHAVSAASSNTYDYDCNGNQTTRVIGGQLYTLGYDAENRLTSVTGPSLTATFVYDGDGRRLISTINGVTTVFAGPHYEKTNGVATKYYFAGTQRVAMRSGSILSYLLSDHLGSGSVVTDASGVTVGETRYYPYGETRLTTGTIYTDKLFTGQREMAGLGIYHYGARFFSPRLGRFLSADTIVSNPFNPQDLNRFSYVRNNPLLYTDPTGHEICDADGYCGYQNYVQGVLVMSGTPSGGVTGSGSGTGASETNQDDSGGIVIPFDTDDIADSIPWTAQQWASGATTTDEIALVWDTLLGIYVLTWVGVGFGGGLVFEGNPVTGGLPGAVAGYIIGEGSVSVSGALFPANLAATGATLAGAIADAKSGNTSINGELSISPNEVHLAANGQIASTTVTSTVLSTLGWAANLVVLSLPLQIAAVENDRGTFGSTNIPVSINVSLP